MKRAIKEKLLNLITFNPIDYCIRGSITPRHIDVSKYVKKDEFISFMNGETTRLEVSGASNISTLEHQLKNATDPEYFIQILNNNGILISKTRSQDLRDNFDNVKSKNITYFIDQMKAFKRQFITLNRTANAYYNDSTVWTLYISYRFLQGKINANVSIKAPLIIYKVTIVEEGSKLFITKLDEQPIVNEKIQIFMNKEYPSISKIDDLLKNISFQEYIERFEKMIGSKINLNEVELLTSFNNNSNVNSNSAISELSIENSALLGIFEPGGGALKEDLKTIIERDDDPFESQIDSNAKSNLMFEEKIIKNPTCIYEIDKPLNIYQKYAVASALSQSTLIYGPPGTGKSEVIANIITNALIMGKTTLMISEKKAALEVLTNRISSLSQFALYLYESNNKELFYKKIDNLNSLLGTQWYREIPKVSKAQMEPLKFNKDELMFIKNYEDWYRELSKILKKQWTIEDYSDGIFKLDYIDVQNIRNELGEDLCIEWLQNINIEGYGLTTLLETFNKIYISCNCAFPSVDSFFSEYLKFKKFVKKFDLLSKFNSLELNKFLKTILEKMTANNRVVEKYLLGGNSLNNLICEYFEFLENYKGKDMIAFLEKKINDKKTFINLVQNFITFREKVISKDPILGIISQHDLIEKIKIIDKFFNKYKKIIKSTDWFDLLLENSKNLELFIKVYNEAQSDEIREIILSEFLINHNIILKINESTLNIKQIKSTSSSGKEFISMLRDFVTDKEHLNNKYIEDFIAYKELFKYDIQFLENLSKVGIIFDNEYQEIIKEWSWISQPYIKYLYQNPVIPFDLAKIQPVIQLITIPINDDQFKKLKIVAMWNQIIKDNPVFLELKGVHVQDIIQQMRREAVRNASIMEELIFKKYINNLRNYLTRLPKDDKDEVANVLRIASSGSRPPIGQFVKHFYSALKKLFPIWVARPDNVADMIPLNAKEFYYGIFDEASQISIERAYPLVYRTEIKVVAGDDKQLRPTSFFMNKLNSQDFEIDDFDAVESLLERAKVSWWNEFHLKNHYRSESKELIEFSNKFIYNNMLEVATKAGIDEHRIEVINVNGVWDQVNRIEADKVIDVLIENYENFKSILIITFNSKQSILIDNLLFERKKKLPKELIEKLDNNDITITNLENVQGNEGDLVILSVSYGKNVDGVVRSNFGPLIASGGSNRLNVAITRAKQKMIVIKSIKEEQIKVNIQNKNAVIFKKFIEYIDRLETNTSINEISQNIIEETIENTEIEQNQEDKSINVQTTFSSRIVKEIYGDLLKSLPNMFEIINDYQVGSKNIDLLIINKNTKLPVKAILIEMWRENRTIKEMLEDIDRQYFLEDRGYSTFRINQYIWCIDKNRILTKIRDSLNNPNSAKIDYVIWQMDK